MFTGNSSRSCAVGTLAAMFIVLSTSLSTLRADDAVPPNPQPRWWKGNLHTHTLWSDGDDFPEMVAEWYRTHNYNFLALSDHNVLSQGMRWMKEADIVGRGGQSCLEKYFDRFGNAWIETRGEGDDREFRLKPFDEYRALVEERGRFIMIPSEEISDKVDGLPVHMNATNLLEAVEPLGGATVREAIANNFRNLHDQAERAGREILVHLNHPNFHWAITAEDLAHIVFERHYEVYNGHPGVNHLGDETHPGVERLWDIANTIRLVDLGAAPLMGIATDDSHAYHGEPGGSTSAARPGRGWVMVRATHLTPESLIRSLKAGDFYASSGVVLADVRYDAQQKKLQLNIEPDGDAVFTTEFIGTLRGVDMTSETVEPPLETDGKQSSSKAPAPITRKYSDAIGEVLATVQGLQPTYQLTGRELYVRAVVTSSKPPVDPSFPDQRRQAWTQPVGWESLPPTGQ